MFFKHPSWCFLDQKLTNPQLIEEITLRWVVLNHSLRRGGFKKQLKNRGSNSVLGIDAQVIAGSLAQGPPMGEAENKNKRGGGGFLRCFSESMEVSVV